MPVAVLLPLIIQAVQIGAPLAQSIFDAGKKELDLLSGAQLTQEERDEIDQALEDANNALQNSQQAP